MALHAAHRQVDRHAAAPTDLHHVAEALRARRFADHADIDRLAALGETLQHLHGTVDRRPFLVAGNQEADRAAEIAAATAEESGRGIGEGSNRPLHVGGTTAEQIAARQLSREGTDRPGGKIARWHHVGMAGKAEMAALRADSGIEVGDIVGAGLREIHALAAEAQRLQRALENLQCARFLRRHAFAADQGARQFNDIGDIGSQGIGHGRTLHPPPSKEKGAQKRRAPAQARRRPVI